MIPTDKDDIHTADNTLKLKILSPQDNSSIIPTQKLDIKLAYQGKYKPAKTEVYLNNRYVLTDTTENPQISFVPADIGNLEEDNQLRVVMYDQAYNKSQATIHFSVK